MVSGTVRTEEVCLGDVKIRFPLDLFGKRRHLAFRGGRKIKSGVINKGVCVCRGRPVDTSAALFEEGGGGICDCCSCCW